MRLGTSIATMSSSRSVKLPQRLKPPTTLERELRRERRREPDVAKSILASSSTRTKRATELLMSARARISSPRFAAAGGRCDFLHRGIQSRRVCIHGHGV